MTRKLFIMKVFWLKS